MLIEQNANIINLDNAKLKMQVTENGMQKGEKRIREKQGHQYSHLTEWRVKRYYLVLIKQEIQVYCLKLHRKARG